MLFLSPIFCPMGETMTNAPNFKRAGYAIISRLKA